MAYRILTISAQCISTCPRRISTLELQIVSDEIFPRYFLCSISTNVYSPVAKGTTQAVETVGSPFNVAIFSHVLMKPLR